MLPSPYHLICSILLSSHFHSFSCFHHYLLHLVSSLPWVDDYSHLSAKWIVISLHSSHHWHWFRDFSLRGCLIGWGSCIHQWFERVCSFLTSFPLEFDLLIIRACTFNKTKQNKNKKERKSVMICLRMVSCSIGHLCHILRSVYWVYLSLWVIVRFFYEFFTLWATLVMHLDCRGFMWKFYEILRFLDHGWYVLGMRDEWPFTKVSWSLSYPPFHHWWYDFPLLY